MQVFEGCIESSLDHPEPLLLPEHFRRPFVSHTFAADGVRHLVIDTVCGRTQSLDCRTVATAPVSGGRIPQRRLLDQY
jgi:hypothetical protein